MANIIDRLDWDSSFFNKKIGKTTVQEIDQLHQIKEENKTEQYDLIYVFTDKLMPEKIVGKPINTKVLFRRDLTRTDLGKFPLDISIYNKNTIKEDLFELAYQAGHFSRFKVDEHFSEVEFKQLYDQWMKKSLNKESMIFTYATRKSIDGMSTLDFKSDRTQIGLIGVDKRSRGKQIGRKLIDACFHHTIKKGLPCLDVFTQAENVTACHFYAACGFQQIYKKYIYHYWT